MSEWGRRGEAKTRAVARGVWGLELGERDQRSRLYAPQWAVFGLGGEWCDLVHMSGWPGNITKNMAGLTAGAVVGAAGRAITVAGFASAPIVVPLLLLAAGCVVTQATIETLSDKQQETKLEGIATWLEELIRRQGEETTVGQIFEAMLKGDLGELHPDIVVDRLRSFCEAMSGDAADLEERLKLQEDQISILFTMSRWLEQRDQMINGKLDQVLRLQGRDESAAATELDRALRARVAPTRLPKTGKFVLGRDKHFKALDLAWEEDARNVVVFVAEGGVGKTALVKHWRASMAKAGFRGAVCVYDHSFHSQGTSDQSASAEVFIREALRWFGDADPDAGAAWAKGARLAELVGRQRTLLVLDGVEPLQDPESGHITDPGLRALVLGLADVNAGLCVVTTRKGLADLADYEGGTVRSVDLANLTKTTGGRF